MPEAQTELTLTKEEPAPVEPPDFFNLYIRKKLGLSDGWRWIRLRAVDGPGGKSYTHAEGAEPTGERYKSGKRKGEINFRKLVPGSERTVIVDVDELDRFKEEWERETGSCFVCAGSGQASYGWSIHEGTKYRPCSRCQSKKKP